MELKFYKTTSEKNKITKTLENEHILTGELKNETSVITPTILVEFDSTIINYNYLYIPEFKRYYYITNISNFRNGLWKVDLTVDVLMSFKDKILGLDVILNNSQETGSNYLYGNQWVTNVKDSTNIISFPGGLNDNGAYILITAGG